MSKKVILAMSGGIDSTVAALLLKEQSYQVEGITLSLYESDIKKAKEAAKLLDIPHKVLDYREYFRQDVMEAFKTAYESGETPNPCIVCNEKIKFGRLFYDKEIRGDSYLATGHYAKIKYDEEKDRHLLLKAKDSSKDQSYFLYRLSQNILGKTLFPLGDMTKDEIREIAVKHGLSDGTKTDSQDICFIKEGNYGDFLKEEMKAQELAGNFIDKEGNILGKHKGIVYYTPGQRRGLELSFDKRKYVIGINSKDNTVVLGDEEDLYSKTMLVGSINLISLTDLKEPIEAEVKTRYSHRGAQAFLKPVDDEKILVEFKEEQRAISPGQSSVFYKDDEVIGGGIILK